MQYSVPCSKECLRQIRDFVSQQLAQTQLSDVERAQVVLAVDEACANAIIHGNHCDSTRTLQLNLEIASDMIHVEISDVGQQLPPAAPTTFDLLQNVSNKAKGGLGLVFMNHIMDSVDYFHRGNIGVCSLTKRLK